MSQSKDLSTKELSDKNGVPYFESFAFGLYECAVCGDRCYKKRISRRLKRPMYADFKETEVLIPAGRQSFHRDCFNMIFGAEITHE